jgi:hypothetical protein
MKANDTAVDDGARYSSFWGRRVVTARLFARR